MVTTNRPLGTCPRCGRELSRVRKLIDFEDASGRTVVFAECADCEDVVRVPQ